MSDGYVAGIVIGAFAFVGAAAGIWGMRHQTSTAARVLEMPESAPESVFLGGALARTVSATWPLARLELFGWGVRLSNSVRLLRHLPLSFPTWEARYEELAVVRSVAGVGAGGVRFALTGSTDAVVFWSGRWSEVLDRLEAAGVTVDRSTTSLKNAGGVYKTW